MPDDRPADLEQKPMLRDCDKVLMLRQLLERAWLEVQPWDDAGDYWRGILTAIGTIIEI